MVIKGGARGRAGDLAAHLQRTDTNERAEVKELRGVVANDIEGALREMAAVASGTRSKRPLYHASLNTAPDEPLTDEQWTRAIDQLEEKLGLTGQPRAVVEHEKEGREHRHVVWSRIDLEHMRAISDSHNYRKHEEVARELEKEFGHARVQGAHVGREGVERPERTPSHAEMQQAERTELTPQQAKEQITAIWQRTDSGKAFAAALEQEGWTLAHGDKRDFVLIDPTGETHSLARRIEGAKAKDVRARMADLDAATLPDIDQAKEQQRARQVAREEVRDAVTPSLSPAPEPRPVPQQAEPELPAPLPAHAETRPAEPEQPQIPTPATPEPETVAPLSVAEEPSLEPIITATTEPEATTLAPAAVDILEPDPPRGNTAARGNVAVEGSAAPPTLADEASEHVGNRDAGGVQALDHDSRAAGAATSADSGEQAPARDESSPVAAKPAESFDLVGGLERGAIMVLDAIAGAAERLVDFVTDFLFGDSSPSSPSSQVDQIREQRRAVAALETIAENLKQGPTVEAAAVRSLTSKQLQRIVQGGDEVLRSLAADVRADRGQERDGGRVRER